ncbi:MAG: GMC family oxidoreductase [Rhodobacter sp.]|nr:GMC family oxidoreductase [Rhodobacter sp.]
MSLDTALAQSWDVLVVGGGMGGSAVTRQLARKGLSVLVLEQGQQAFAESADINKDETDPDQRMKIGRFPAPLTGTIDGTTRDFYAPLGAGVGGSSLLYAAALDRFQPRDFERRTHPGDPGGRLGWPVGYGEIEPYYQEAEAALSVTGTPDPLNPEMNYRLASPDPMNARDTWISAAFEKAGLHPYRLHVGIENRKGCDWCLARVCLSGCKRHGGNAFMDPALQSGRVAVLAGVTVDRVLADRARVGGVAVRAGPRKAELTARAVVLAAGAYFTPVLMLKSASEHWPNGLANAHDQVGRNLMIHFGIRFAVFARRNLSLEGHRKALGFRDFYNHPDGPFGEVQSTGGEATAANVLYALRQRIDETPLRHIPMIRHLLRGPAALAPLLFGNAAIMSAMMEDFPYEDNRVVLDPDTPSGMRFHYRMDDEAQARGTAYVKLLKARLRGHARIQVLSARPNLNFGHPCGTCRAGDDPARSVVDRDGRTHGLENLYVADAAFLPTSGGTNPSLTIAANALRIGDRIAAHLNLSEEVVA